MDHLPHEEFIRRLADLTIEDLDAVSCEIEASMMCSASWLEWRRAVDSADRAVRRAGRTREAGTAAHEAAAAVLSAFEREVSLPDARVTMVARAAREAAAALVAEDLHPGAAERLLAPWGALVGGELIAA